MNVQTAIRLHNPSAPPSPYRPRTAYDLMATILETLTNDGWAVEPGSVSSEGLSVVISGTLHRLTLDDGDLMDDADWVAYTDRMEVRHAEMAREAQERIDRDWMADTGADVPF
jgi:hypothetical protein